MKTVRPPSSDMPLVEPTVRQILAAMADIEVERPELFEAIRQRAGLLTAGAAKTLFDGFAGRRGGWVDYDALGEALVRIARNLPEIGRLGLSAALVELCTLVIIQTPEAEQPAKIREMTDWMLRILMLFDGDRT